MRCFADETAAYEELQPYNIGPKFLGHIVEHDRVVGMLLEKIEGRHPGIEDLEICQAELKRLHQAGFLHGDLNKHNIVIRDGKAVLIDFQTTEYCDDQDELDAEYAKLESCLLDTSGRGGVVWTKVDAETGDDEEEGEADEVEVANSPSLWQNYCDVM